MNRRRADVALVEAGLFDSRAKAGAAIQAGLVSADGVAVAKPASPVSDDAVMRATPAHLWVSRGGVKLAAALDAFALSPAGRTCLDVGASTGGFTDVLLSRGARHVYAVDVGRDQLHATLRADPRVTSLERTDIRAFSARDIPEPFDLVGVDVSFISLNLVLPAVSRLAGPGADLVVLIKPQFEVGRGALKKGFVRDPEVHRAVCGEVDGAVKALGWTVRGTIPSPIAGGGGNLEFLLGAHRGRD